MSLIPCITLANLTTPVAGLGGSNNPNPTFSTINTETIVVTGVDGANTAVFANKAVNDIVVAMIGTETGAYPVNQSGKVNTEYLVNKPLGVFSLGSVGFDTLRTTRVNNQYDCRIFNSQGGNTANLIVDGFGELNAANSDVYASTVTTQAVFIEGQVLTADNDQLFLNGIPVATSANISSIADWSLYAQVSTLDGNNQNIKNVNNIEGFSGNFQSLTTTVLTVNTVVSQSTITNYSTITTVDVLADLGNISTLTGTDLSFVTVAGQASFASTITLGDTTTGLLSVNGAGALLYNGSTITSGSGGSASNWSGFPATQTVNFNTFGINNGGAFNAASLATSGNIFSLGSMSAAANVTGNNVTGTNGVFGSGVNVSGNVNSATVTTGTVTASGLVNCQSGLNGVGEISLIGNVGDTVKLATDANATGIRLQAGAMLLTTAAAFSLNAGGAGNLAAGGAISIAAGDYIQLNAGYIDCIGGSIIKVNSIQKQSGSLSIDSTTIVNSGTIYTNVLSAPSIIPSLAGQTSSIVGVDLIANSNSFIARNMVASTLTVSTITGNTIFLNGLETASIDKVSTLTASSITSYFGSISTLNISTLNSFPAYQILPNQPTYQIYVAKNGSDTLGTGSIMQPFLTIGKALTTATAYPDTNIVTILLTPGNYSEAVNVTRNNTFINGLSVNSQEVSITGAVSFTTTTQTIGYIIGGIVGLTINGSLTFSSTAAVPILYTALSGVINGISGTIPLTISQTSTTNSFSFTTQGMVISPVDTIGVSVNNTRVSFVQTLITGTTTLVQTTGVGSFTIFGSTLTNTNATATAPPIVKLANTSAVATGAMQINNSYLSYTSATVDTGLNKCCVQLSTTTTAAMNMSYNFLYCEGARVTNGSAGQYLCVQNPGTGTITFNYGGNYSGASANRFPNASAKFVKTGYVATT